MCFTNLQLLCRLSVALTSIIALANCSLLPKKEVVKSALPEGAWWTHGSTDGDPKIIISLKEQRVALFKDDQPVGVSPISSGKEGYSTQAGTYKITEKDHDHRSSWYGAYCDETDNIVVEDIDVRVDPKPPGTHFVGAEMQFFMRIHGPIGMHRGYLPGYPASHGCIRLPGTMAALFFAATPEGTPVEIQDHAGLANLKPAPEVALTNSVETKAKPVEAPKSKTSETPKLPKALKALASAKDSRRTWFASAKKPASSDLQIAPATRLKKDIKPTAKKPWFASLRLPAVQKTLAIKTVTPQKPRLKPVTLPASPASAPEPKISQPQAIVMTTPKPQPLLPKIRTQKATKPKPGQTLYWNGN